MKIAYNRVEYLTSEIDIDEVLLEEKFDGDIVRYIQYHEDEDPSGIERIDVFDVKIEIL